MLAAFFDTFPLVLTALLVLYVVVSGISFVLRQRLIAKVARHPCQSCGKPLSRRAVEDARERALEERRELFREAAKKGLRLRVSPIRWRILCPGCGTMNIYRTEMRSVTLEQEDDKFDPMDLTR